MSDENEGIVGRIYHGVLSQGKLEVADELVAADVVEPNQPAGLPPGREGFTQWTSMMREIFPDLTASVDLMLAEDDLGAARATWRGTNTVGIMGREPTGKSIVITSTDIFRLRRGVCVEHVGNYDQLGMLRQLGLMQP
ncbi:MAG TPA: ester cyclase [Gaiellaceae bacterium]